MFFVDVPDLNIIGFLSNATKKNEREQFHEIHWDYSKKMILAYL